MLKIIICIKKQKWINVSGRFEESPNGEMIPWISLSIIMTHNNNNNVREEVHAHGVVRAMR